MKAKRTVKLASESLHRNWQMLLYPESCAEDWREYLIEMGVSWIASPLHDGDVNDDGKFKKPHYHLYVTYEGKKRYSEVLHDIAEPINAVFPDLDNAVVIKDMKSAISYLTHDGFTGKKLYSESQIKKSPSFDIDRFTKISESEIDNILFEIIDYIEDNDVTELRDLILYCRYNQNDWFQIVKSKTIFFSHYITSKRHKEKADSERADN